MTDKCQFSSLLTIRQNQTNLVNMNNKFLQSQIMRPQELKKVYYAYIACNYKRSNTVQTLKL